jgi:hypothetical protein
MWAIEHGCPWSPGWCTQVAYVSHNYHILDWMTTIGVDVDKEIGADWRKRCQEIGANWSKSCLIVRGDDDDNDFSDCYLCDDDDDAYHDVYLCDDDDDAYLCDDDDAKMGWVIVSIM